MRISDWSSDVCSSDLVLPRNLCIARRAPMFAAMLLRTVHCVDGGDGGMQAVRSAPGSCQVALALRRVMPPRIWRRAFHEAHRADEGIDDAGVVAHAGNRAQALVQGVGILAGQLPRSEEHTSKLQSLMRISYAVFCLKK